MKTIKFLGSLAASVILTLGACVDNVDESNLYVQKSPTVTQYLEQDTVYSSFVKILKQVKLSNRANASSMASVLAARGNYTCFVPTNAAIRHFVDSVTGTPGFDLNNLPDSIAQIIAKNSVIDNGSNKAYRSPDFPADGFSFTLANMNNRLLKYSFDSVTGASLINQTAMVSAASRDILVSNGVIHQVNAVISPSNNSVASQVAENGNMKIMGRLLVETGWADKLSSANMRDQAYEDIERTTAAPRISRQITRYATTHNTGYTIFAETDETLAAWGIPMPEVDASGVIQNWEAILSAVKAKVAGVYRNTSDDLTSADNAVNQFVAYHIVEGKIADRDLVRHYNEFEYKRVDNLNPQTTNLTIDIWSFFQTKTTPKRLLKVLHAAEDGNIYLNRKVLYDNAFFGKYRVKQSSGPGVVQGQRVDINKAVEALNGYVYPLEGVLLYDSEVEHVVLNDRLRFDFCTILPEIYSNTLRGRGINYYFDKPSEYFSSIVNATQQTTMTYLDHASTGGGETWFDLEGDELMVLGLYDITFTLPPVPTPGTYEIRLGLSQNSRRGMGQVYFGSDKDGLVATGLPIDMRPVGSTSPGAIIPWFIDHASDESINVENDRNMRNQGLMKGPKSISHANNATKTLRDVDGFQSTFRRILTRQYLEPGTTYYLRFKSALDKTDSELFLDYFELVPASVYDNAAGEDVW